VSRHTRFSNCGRYEVSWGKDNNPNIKWFVQVFDLEKDKDTPIVDRDRRVTRYGGDFCQGPDDIIKTAATYGVELTTEDL
tara:strand:+ start:2075 stop:2314 length:240 start_codon:yes stop_codon:yes gene_type:complete